MVSYSNQPRPLKQRSLSSGGGGLAQYLVVARNVLIGDSHLWSGCYL